MRVAITREVSPAFERCELTHLERAAIDVDLARRQHQAYEDCLAALGCQVQRLPSAPDMPDSVFVEDIAVVLPEAAVITRPGAASRRLEVPAVAEALIGYRNLLCIEPPGTLDGGDVLQLGQHLYVGLSGRTDEQGIEQLRRLVGPLGYNVTAVPVQGCLHLKSAVAQAGSDVLLANPDWVEVSVFAGWKVLEIDPAEPFAANALLVGGSLVYPAAYPRTRSRLERADIRVEALEVSEIAKAEGGVTCCSLVFEA
jgi:dimethylargininase